MDISLNSVQKSRRLILYIAIALISIVLITVFLINYFTQGTLKVTSPQSEVRITIDPPQEEGEPDPNNPKKTIKAVTPLSLSLPVGKHQLIAVKPDYNFLVIDFEIKPHEETKVEVDLPPLIPQETPDSWKSRLPFQDQYYYVEYDPKRDLIIATLSPPPAVETTRQLQLDYLKRQVSEQLALRGADLNKQKIEWREK